MAISNKTGRMLLTTGNKSKMAVGYATLYGDMAGGFAPIKDCSKLLVYRLATWRNSKSRVIPPRVIERPPSAELRPIKKHRQPAPTRRSIRILEAFIQEDLIVDQIVCTRLLLSNRCTCRRWRKRNEQQALARPARVRVSGGLSP